MSLLARAAQPLRSLLAEFAGHVRGLRVLFTTEMWERFSYYGMRALLVLFMTTYLFINGNFEGVIGYYQIRALFESIYGEVSAQQLSSHVYGTYTALVYLFPILGGWVADRFLGQRRSVYLGGTLMAIGHFLMTSERTFFIALVFMILGNGFFKPNITAQIGNLYKKTDPRYDRAFTIFYMGINLGAFFSPIVCGTLGQSASFGWHWGFGAAGVGMCIGVLLYHFGQRHLPPDRLTRIRKEKIEIPKEPLTPQQWLGIGALILLCVPNSIFWAVYEQQGNTMQLWANDQTRWPVIFGWQVPSTWYQSFNPFIVFFGIPVINALWARQAKRGKEPNTVKKMAIGCFLLGLSFIVMIIGARLIGDGKGSLFWPTACVAMLTVGEIYLSPVGLSLVNRIAPPRMVSMMVGVWFFSIFVGNFLSGYIGSFYETMSRESFFGMLCVLGCVAGAMLWGLSFPLRKALTTSENEAS